MRQSRWIGACALLVAAAALLLVPGMASLGLSAPDEPRAAAVAREMFALPHGLESLVLLRLNEAPYTQKPPLYYWLAAAASSIPGEVTEWSARLPSVVAGLATVLLTLALGRRLFGARTAWLGAAFLLTTYTFAHLARRVQFDVLLTFFELAALAALWRMDRGAGSPNASRLAAHGAMGLGMLVKGPVGFLLPVLSWLGFLAMEGRLREARRAFSAPALLLSLGPILAWLAGAMALAPPGFFGTAVGGGVVSRFFEGTSHARPFYYYLYQFPIEFLPWTLLLPALWIVGRRQVFVAGADPERRRAWRFGLACVGVTLVFFSLSAGKRGLYVVPCFPLLALLCADALHGLLEQRTRPPRALGVAFGGAGLALAALGVWAWQAGEVAGADIPVALCAALLGVPTAGALGWRACVVRGGTRELGFVLAGTAWGVLAAAFWLLYPALDPINSMKPIARSARHWTPDDQPLALLGSRPMIGGLAYYAERPIEWIDDVEDVPAYLAGGGTTLITKAKKLEALGAIVPIEVLDRLREGDRAVAIVRLVPSRTETKR